MSTIEQQLELEQKMVNRSAEAYINNNRKMEEKGNVADLDYSRRLMKEFLQPLIEGLSNDLSKTGPGYNGRAKQLLKRVDPDKAMFITLRCLFNSFSTDEAIANTATKIGKMIEDEVRFTRFQELYGDYYDTIIKDFQRKGTRDYRYMQRVLTHQANENEDQWITWSQSEKADVGARLIDVVLQYSTLIEKKTYYKNGKTYTAIDPTDETTEWIKEHEHVQQFLHPYREPCIIEPDPWTGLYQGGYYSPRLRHDTPMVKSANKRHKLLLEKANLDRVAEALNLIQNVPWSVNTEVLDVIRQVWAMNLGIGMPRSKKFEATGFPLRDGIKKEEMTEDEYKVFMEWKREVAEAHTQEKERVAKSIQVSRIVRLANDYREYDKFWFVWYCDFRGRMYTATAGFSPQGPDIAKGLLRFARGKPLGDRGYRWIKIHLANRFGFDKATYDERVAWVDERHEEFMRAASDPIAYRSVWEDADKPWQFLAALFEYRRINEAVLVGARVEDFVSHLPIGLDGSCNGLQNFSAMLRDSVGGAATNLTANEEPADIYSQVAKVCYEKLKKMEDPMAIAWLQWANKYGKDENFPRDLPKRPVMTLPYGSTKQSCTNYIYQHIVKYDKKHFIDGNFQAARWLTPILWDSIGEVVIAARDAMAWLKDCASAMNKKNLPLTWQTADGFIATQHARQIKKVQVRTQLNGMFQMALGQFTDKIAPIQQRNGISPNFVHSQDSLHLRTTVRLAARKGIVDVACIHDDYGTHACDTDELQNCIRQAFVALYQSGDPLLAFKNQQEAYGKMKMPELPPKGDLDITEVLRSEHFFG